MAAKELNVKLLLRGDTKSKLESVDPVLGVNEMCIEKDTRKFKFGDGISKWSELEYAGAADIAVDALLSATSENPIQNKAVNAAVHYTNDTPTISSLGGVAVGTTFDNMPVTDVLTKILYPYTKPAVSISVSPNGGTYEKGTSVSLSSLKTTVTRKSSDIASVVGKQGSTVLTTITSGVASGGTFNLLPSNGISITSNTSFSAIATDIDGGATTANGGSFTFVDPYFYGVFETNSEPQGTDVAALTKDIKGKGAKTYTYTTNGQCMVIAYPASYGVLKSALDPNGFENIGSFTKYDVTVPCTSGNVAYYVYVKTASTVSDFAMKFTY